MKVVWTATAIAQLEVIEDYLAADDPDAAPRFVDGLIDAGDALADSPLRGRAVSELPGSGLREVVHRGYRVAYRVAPSPERQHELRPRALPRGPQGLPFGIAIDDLGRPPRHDGSMSFYRWKFHWWNFHQWNLTAAR